MVDEQELRELERRLRGIPEAAMRREVVREQLEAREAPDAYALVFAGVRRPERERPALPHLREALHEVLVEGGGSRDLDYERRATLYSIAAERGDEFVMRLLRSADAVAAMEDPGAALPRTVADIPLGVRRALARKWDKGLLERLLLDPDPIVIEHLLENPRVTEDDVVRIAARRPIPASTLALIRRSGRFGSRLRVRIAIARNPYCPTDLAIETVATLGGTVLHEIAQDATLHEEVRQHARDEVERRSVQPDAGEPDASAP
ncbi:MAG: hypothetical protein JSU66_06025 [Deltaproteobacteria bacterium]|nr:MAG: hypothetical protein JSU66_06025 [Deltaproteobacteria bacterium]